MITKNNTSRVMELFFKFPGRKFHLRELERITGLSMPGVRKIAKRLEDEELLLSKKENVVKNFFASRNEKFVSLKRSYNLYSIYDSGLLGLLRERYEEPEAIVLFGSYSKGEDTAESDIDIAVVTRKGVHVDLSKFEKVLERKISVYEISISKAEPEFINSIANGVVLHGYLKVIQ